MAATLKSLTEGSSGLAVAYRDDPQAVTIWSRPLTPRIERQISALAEGENSTATSTIVPLVLALVAKWDLRPDEKSPVLPLTDEGVQDVPFALLMAIIEAIGQDQGPKAATTEPSS